MRNNLHLAVLGAVTSGLLGLSSPVNAQSMVAAPVMSVEAAVEDIADGEIISEIHVEGAQRLEKDTILSYLT
ncbi:MAG TPA: hypothetical protein DCY07_02550, partial [Rhodospirillaceae bacterium]|nr:hypothetical protein [Rhodospirillaceae bacterium]